LFLLFLSISLLLLFRKTFFRAIGAKDTTIAYFWFELGIAIFTVVEIFASVDRHFFFLLKSARWAV